MQSDEYYSRSGPKGHRASARVAEAARTSTACTACRNRKIKCSGAQPCRFCTKRRQNCVFPDTARGKKKLYSIEYVEELERQAARESSQSRPTGQDEPLEHSPELLPSPKEGQGAVCHGRPDMQSALVPEPAMTSSLRFGTRIKCLSMDSPTSQLQHHLDQPPSVESPDNAYNLVSQSHRPLREVGMIQWPTEEEAQSLLETFLNYLGTVQHLIDPRDFSDRLAANYDHGAIQQPLETLWSVKFLLVMAIGELLQGKMQPDAAIPGACYFQEGIDRLPGLAALRRSGIMAVEIMSLAAFYLQCADCKEDAFIYAGLGMRLAVSNGMARQEEHKRTSEATHKNRVWWTIYMQERRLAAATGNPVGISDKVITSALPITTPGFQPAGALVTNIKLARIVGSISQEIYSRKHQSERQFVLQIQKFLASLFETQKEMPSEYAVDLCDESRVFSRTGATLYLMLFQAVMLVTRPILLHVTRANLQGDSQLAQATQADSSPLDKLCTICVDAARNTVKIMETLKNQAILTKFGFFDLDAIFSSAFVLVMAEHSSIDTSMAPSLRNAIALLHYLESCGNRAAGNRLTDIRQMCSCLSISTDQRVTTLLSNGAEQSVERAASDVQTDVGVGEVPSMSPWNALEGFLNNDTDMVTLDGGDIDLPNFWQDNGLSLDGTVETDWGELERIASQFQ